MSDDSLRLVVGGILLVHGIAHVGPIGAQLWIRSGHVTPAGSWSVARSWAAPGLSADAAGTVAGTFWVFSLVGFILTALAFWGIGLPVVAWRPLGVGSALASTAGIVLFAGTWPGFNTAAALGVNIGVIVVVLTGWLPASVVSA